MTVPRWYAVSVYARREAAAAEDLEQRGFDVFLPTSRSRRAYSDRIRVVEVPLFSGYLFVRTELNAAARVQLLKAPAVKDLVGRTPGAPYLATAIRDHEVTSLQILQAADRAVDPVRCMVPGRPVRVVTGPLKGAWGIIEEAPDARRRMVMQIHLLGRGARCILSADDVLLEAEGAVAPA